MNKTIDSFNSGKLQVASFYSFTTFDEKTIKLLKKELETIAKEKDLKGTILMALEGVNGTICGDHKSVELLLNEIKKYIIDQPLEVKFSWTIKQAFRRFKARIKKEIVTIGIKEVDPVNDVGIYVEPEDWNSFLTDPKTLVIDTRNEYEVSIGTFQGAVNPHIDTFREFPQWVENYLRPLVEEQSPEKLAMFCTGGIRCEKATSYLKEKGFKGIHHLHGGILNYFQKMPEDESLWEGECFVFDQRVSLNQELSPGKYRLCHACGMPLSPEDLKKSTFIRGVQCYQCLDKFTDFDRERFAERQKQIDDLSERLPNNSIWPNS